MRSMLIAVLSLFLANGCCFPNDGFYDSEYTNHPNWWLLPSDSCGKREEFDNGLRTRVLGGSDAELGQYPWMAELVKVKLGGFEHHCGGSIINDRYILTAAHCVESIQDMLVRLGELTRSTSVDCSKDKSRCAPPAVYMDIEYVVIHPQFFYFGNLFPKHDIALLRLRHQIEQFNDFIRPICLPTFPKHGLALDNKFMEVAGWGNTVSGTQSDTLQTIKVPIVPQKQCSDLWHRLCVTGREAECLSDIHENVMCANTRRAKGICVGDSGGPLMTSLPTQSRETSVFLIGIASYGKPCGLGFPDVYTRVSEYMPWILDNIY